MVEFIHPVPEEKQHNSDKAESVPLGANATPMMIQYLAIKEQYLDALLFYRMGDFYELFFEDAIAAAAALDIALTKRGKHLGADIPMCGVPAHSHESYLSKLIRKGFKVAVCEQLEEPLEARKRGYKEVVKRDVVRLITPGTLTEDTLLDARSHNFLAALTQVQDDMALAWLDISTGDFFVESVSSDGLSASLARLAPGELIIAEQLSQSPKVSANLDDWRDLLSPLPGSRFDSTNARRRLEDLYKVKALDAFGAFTRADVAAAGALVDYVELTQKGRMPRIKVLQRFSRGAAMEIDVATRRNLELTKTLSGERVGSLLSSLDRTVTGAGARLLAERLSAPLTDVEVISSRLDAVEFFFSDRSLCSKLRELLRTCPDVERSLARVSLGRGGPRDLDAINRTVALIPAVKTVIEEGAVDFMQTPMVITQSITNLGDHKKLQDQLTCALADDLPLLIRDGGFIAAGYNSTFDELCALRDESRRLIAALQSRYTEETQIQSLKVRHNNVIGYFIEVSAKNADRLLMKPSDTEDSDRQPTRTKFIHRQTLASAVRFTTSELADLEVGIRSAADKAMALELTLFESLVAQVTARAAQISAAASALAELDVSSALADLAEARNYVRPRIDASLAFEVTAARHPVVEAALTSAGEVPFVSNGCNLGAAANNGPGRVWLVTGPNMAGKSTFLRQNALIVIMAQTGSFVPAETAHIGVVDKVFSRVGAADELARGRSTFMVEMIETAAILNQATDRSLVILDEIGRGTATFDGLSIAWATLEYLHDSNCCRALFATHYHELTALARRLQDLAPHTMRVKEWEGEIVFLHEVTSGAADRSYGIYVARLAGLPGSVIARADAVLAELDQADQTGVIARLAEELPLFAAVQDEHNASVSGRYSPLVAALSSIHPDELTPREALEALYKLKELLSEEQ